MAAPMLALPSGARAERRGTLTLTSLLAGTALLMLIGGLIAGFLAIDDAVAKFPPAKLEPDNYSAVMVTISLLMASVAIEWAVHAIRNEERKISWVALGIAIGLALAAANSLWYLASRLPFGVATHAYGTIAYTMFVVSGLALAVAIGFLLFTFFRVIGGQADHPTAELPRAMAWFWHSVVLAWFGVFFTLYLFNLMFK